MILIGSDKTPGTERELFDWLKQAAAESGVQVQVWSAEPLPSNGDVVRFKITADVACLHDGHVGLHGYVDRNGMLPDQQPFKPIGT